MARKQRRVPKDKATGLPKKYLSGAKNRSAKAREIKRTYLSSGSRNVPMAAWAMGRVNSFVSGKGGARKADADILARGRKKK
jgi:hypothetical protein